MLCHDYNLTFRVNTAFLFMNPVIIFEILFSGVFVGARHIIWISFCKLLVYLFCQASLSV